MPVIVDDSQPVGHTAATRAVLPSTPSVQQQTVVPTTSKVVFVTTNPRVAAMVATVTGNSTVAPQDRPPEVSDEVVVIVPTSNTEVEDIAAEEPTSTSSLGENPMPAKAPHACVPMKEWEEYSLYHYYCQMCSKVVESHRLWMHLQDEPGHADSVDHLSNFNGFHLRVREDTTARRKAKRLRRTSN